MPSGFWDYIHLGRTRSDEDDEQAQHNLQEGLFQIASQTCNILVQVNNTNNINVGSNFHYTDADFQQPSTSTGTTRKTTFFDLEQSVVLLQPKQSKSPATPSTPTKGRLQHRLSEYKRRLSVSSSIEVIKAH